MTDFRALCAELHAAFNTYAVGMVHHGLLERTRASLAEQPVGPTDKELRELRRQHDWPVVDSLLFSIARAVLARWGRPVAQPTVNESLTVQPAADELTGIALQMLGTIEGIRLVIPEITDTIKKALEQNRPATEPVPVSERLPGPEDCDAEGRCWWGRFGPNDWCPDWTLTTHEVMLMFCDYSPREVWLPANALPTHEATVHD